MKPGDLYGALVAGGGGCGGKSLAEIEVEMRAAMLARIPRKAPRPGKPHLRLHVTVFPYTCLWHVTMNENSLHQYATFKYDVLRHVLHAAREFPCFMQRFK